MNQLDEKLEKSVKKFVEQAVAREERHYLEAFQHDHLPIIKKNVAVLWEAYTKEKKPEKEFNLFSYFTQKKTHLDKKPQDVLLKSLVSESKTIPLSSELTPEEERLFSNSSSDKIRRNEFMALKEVFTLENYEDTTKFVKEIYRPSYSYGYDEPEAFKILRTSIHKMLDSHQLSQHLKKERVKHTDQANQIIQSTIKKKHTNLKASKASDLIQAFEDFSLLARQQTGIRLRPYPLRPFNSVEQFIKDYPWLSDQDPYILAPIIIEECHKSPYTRHSRLQDISLQLQSKSAEIRKNYTQHFEDRDIDLLKWILYREKEIALLTQIKFVLGQKEYADFMNEIVGNVRDGLLPTSQSVSRLKDIIEEFRLSR